MLNPEQVKAKLLKINKQVEDFKVIFSGKSSKQVDGLYKPSSKEILLHNQNFGNDNVLIYTAIHELAHHIQFTTTAIPVSQKAHTVEFWNLQYNLLATAEAKGIYRNIALNDEKLATLTEEIKKKYLLVNGELMAELGHQLIQAQSICDQIGFSFEDYVDRTLTLPRTSAKAMMKSYIYNINPAIGFENMKTVAGIKQEDKRAEAEKMFMQGASPATVKMKYNPPRSQSDPLLHLEKERKTLASQIKSLKNKLSVIDERIAQYKQGNLFEIVGEGRSQNEK